MEEEEQHMIGQNNEKIEEVNESEYVEDSMDLGYFQEEEKEI